MDELLALRIGALRLARRRGRTREAAWAAARLRLTGVALEPGEARFARDVRVKFGHALRVARLRGPRTPTPDAATSLVEPPRSRRKQLVAALMAAALLLGAVLLYLRYQEPAGAPEGVPPVQQVVVATPPPPLRGRTQPGVAAPVAIVEVTPTPTAAPPATPAPGTGTGTAGGGTGGGGSGGGTGNGNGTGTPAPTPTPTPTPTPGPTPTIDPSNLMHVHGQVVDAVTRQPIPNVCYGPGIVSCAGQAVTDAGGFWEMYIDVAKNPNTTWRVLFITPGYRTGSSAFQSRRGDWTQPPVRMRVGP